MKTVVHIDQQKMRRGEPAITVRTYKGSEHYTRAAILGPAFIVQSPEPDRYGARVWIETHAEVIGVE